MSFQNTRQQKRIRSQQRAERKHQSARRIPFCGVVSMRQSIYVRPEDRPLVPVVPAFAPEDRFARLKAAYEAYAPEPFKHGKPGPAPERLFVLKTDGLVDLEFKACTKSEALAQVKKFYNIKTAGGIASRLQLAA